MNGPSFIQGLAATVANGPVRFMLDKGVAASTTAAGLCKLLEGKALQLDPGNEELAVYFAVADGHLSLHPGSAEHPDAVLAGTPLNLARLSLSDPAAVIRSGDVRVSGDTDVAEQFQYLLQLVRPDMEEELSKVTGDVIAHEVGRFARGLAGWASTVATSLGRSTGEYLSEETDALATATEIEEFCTQVDDLSAAVERLEARLHILRSSIESEAP
jgi:ubiquinone biosynthesis protein UbiJ